MDGLLSEGSFNFSSVPTRAQRAKLVAKAARTNGKINFLQQLEEVCKLVEGWKFPKRHLTILFGPGGTMKSYLALFALGQLAIAGVSVGFVDWELDESDHSQAIVSRNATMVSNSKLLTVRERFFASEKVS